MISLKNRIIEALSRIRSPKDEDIEIPIEWATDPKIEPINTEPVAEWPPKSDKKRLRPLNVHKHLVLIAKLLFLAYTALSIGFILQLPFGLVLTIPTLAVLIDYIRNDKIIKQLSNWWTPDEHRDTPSEG